MKPEQTSTPKSPHRVRRHGLVLKIMLGKRGLSVRLTPVFLILAAVLLVTVFCRVQALHQSRLAEQQARIAELELENKRIRTFLARKEREKNQMLALADARSEELWSEIETRDQDIEQLWKVVGKKPVVEPSASRRKSLTGSRRGDIHPLAMKLKYRELYSALNLREGEVEKLAAAAENYRREAERQRRLAIQNAIPSLWPCRGRFSSGFGNRIHPVYGYGRFHSGVDITAPYGTPIRATGAGRVVASDYSSGYGLNVVIDHGNGLRTLYGHCSSLAAKKGAFVKKAQIIGYVGSTGLSTGPHVHYEVVRGGVQIDPLPYLKEKDLHTSIAKN